MPFYEYECSACHHYIEALQKISDAPLRKCPDCGKSTLKRLVSAPVFRLKGGGWYETDFKSDKEQKRNIAGREEGEAKSDAKAEPAKEESKSAESKPAETKTETSKPEPVKTAASKSAAKPSAKAKPAAKPAAKKKAKRR
jgi:putative FmdB family regulatory protein